MVPFTSNLATKAEGNWQGCIFGEITISLKTVNNNRPRFQLNLGNEATNESKIPVFYSNCPAVVDEIIESDLCDSNSVVVFP